MMRADQAAAADIGPGSADLALGQARAQLPGGWVTDRVEDVQGSLPAVACGRGVSGGVLAVAEMG
jgi:hypothetical protein